MAADPLITTQALALLVGAPELSVVDATWFMPGDPRNARDEHARGHIPGAVYFDIDAIADTASSLPHMLPSPDAFARAAGALGLSRDKRTIVYDALGIFSAPRVWWTLRVMGFQNVAVLDGGLRKWLAEGRPVEAGAIQPVATHVAPDFDPALVADLAAIRDAVARPGQLQILDARPAPRFSGEAPEPRPGLRGGHMPGAVSLPFAALVGEDGTLKSAADLAALFAAAGADPRRPAVATCGSGVSAAVIALALARLGHDRTAVYDGAWAEWGGRADTPVATGHG